MESLVGSLQPLTLLSPSPGKAHSALYRYNFVISRTSWRSNQTVTQHNDAASGNGGPSVVANGRHPLHTAHDCVSISPRKDIRVDSSLGGLQIKQHMLV